MRKSMLLASMIAMMMVAASSTMAQAQEHGSEPFAQDSSPAPAYEVQPDGTVLIGSHVQTNCSTFAIVLEDGYQQGLTEVQARGVLEECEARGFLSHDVIVVPDSWIRALLPVVGGAIVIAGIGLTLKRLS